MNKYYLFFLVYMVMLFFSSCGPHRNVAQEEEMHLNALETKLNEISNYPVITLHGTNWLAKNLGVSFFKNGDTIFHARSEDEWKYAADNEIPAWTYFDYREPSFVVHLESKFYNWYAINDLRGLAPAGWRMPTVADWDTLISYYSINREKTKELKDDASWGEKSGNNASGFNAVAYGFCYSSYGGCANEGINAVWWCSDDANEEEAWYVNLDEVDQIQKMTSEKTSGFSVRLIKD